MVNKLAHLTDEEIEELEKMLYSMGFKKGFELAKERALKILIGENPKEAEK
ncbi:MAG TPA: hypothetical protein VLH56_15220 [Dissulfurispiraceae bacterium]|nr:hypothetical protein [Dissulfurispiraceae bacterium]